MGKRKMEYWDVDSNDRDILSDEGEKHKEEEENEEEQSERVDVPVGGEDDDGIADEEEDETFPPAKYGRPARKDPPSSRVPPIKKVSTKNGISRDLMEPGPSSLPPSNKRTKKSNLNHKTAVGSRVCILSHKSRSEANSVFSTEGERE